MYNYVVWTRKAYFKFMWPGQHGCVAENAKLDFNIGLYKFVANEGNHTAAIYTVHVLVMA